jgi:hypothetical protein
MKLFLKIFLLLSFYTNLQFIFCDEFDDLVGKIMGDPENLFSYLCDTNKVYSDKCKQLELYHNVYQRDIEIFNECKTAKLLDKTVKITDSIRMSYNFYYDFPQYHKDLLITFHFQKEQKTGKIKLYSYFIMSRMKDDFMRKVIEKPDNLNHYLKDTNYIDTLFWILTTKDSIKKFGKFLNYIKRNKLKLLDIDHRYNYNSFYATYDDPKFNCKRVLSFHYGIDNQSRKYKIKMLNTDIYLPSD